MANSVSLIVTANMAAAFGAFTKLVEHQGKAERGFGKMTAAGNRAEQAQTRAVQKMVAGVQQRTRNAELAMTQTARAAARAGRGGSMIAEGSGGGSAFVREAQDRSFQRFQRAQQLKDGRSFQRFIQERNFQQSKNLSLTGLAHSQLMNRASGISARGCRLVIRTWAGGGIRVYAAITGSDVNGGGALGILDRTKGDVAFFCVATQDPQYCDTSHASPDSLEKSYVPATSPLVLLSRHIPLRRGPRRARGDQQQGHERIRRDRRGAMARSGPVNT